MENRERKNELKIYLSDKEQYILEQKVKIQRHTRKNQRQPEPDSKAHERHRKCV